jgi:hypothetical protein
MRENKLAETEFADSAAFNRRFKYALIAYAVVEFIVIALVVYSKVRK